MEPDDTASVDQPTMKLFYKHHSDGVIRNVQHVQQQSTWDCGLACVMMVLPLHSRLHMRANLPNVCGEEYSNQSTWTIDLCYLLHRYSIQHRYLTRTTGVDPNFVNEGFYSHIISKDQQRVNDKFRGASAHGIFVEEWVCCLNDILEHVAQKGPAIVLADSTLLHCLTCPVGPRRVANRVKELVGIKTFCGHFIVVSGFDRRRKIIFYADPSSNEKVCCVGFDRFDKARRSYGTDEDVILIDKEPAASSD